MKFPDTSSHGRAQRRLSASPAALCVALLVALAAGCASPRPPRPPSLNLPEMVKDLSAQRVGGQVMLHWTTPEKTTDRLESKGPVTAEICRIDQPDDQPDVRPSPPCTPVARLYVSPGASEAAETLPQSLTAGPARLLAYRIQLFNSHEHSAGLSAQAFAAAGAAPPPVEQLRAAAAPAGATLEWRRQNTAASVELDRLLVNALNPQPGSPNAPRVPAKANSSTSARKAGAARSSTPRPLGTSPHPPDEVKLQTPKQVSDPGGVVDTTTRNGETYRYTAQRVLAISLDGHALTLRSLASAPATVVMRDIFPPAVPTGLEAIPAAATPAAAVPADHSVKPSIDLSWTPGTDADLAGYIVYRQDVTATGALAGPAIRLNRTPVAGPAYRDQTVVPGQRYAYRVTAVDASGNESKPGVDVQEMVREP